MWTVEHEADIASDLSAFHRIDDVKQMDAERYFSLAQRLTTYSGVLGAIAAERYRREQDRGNGSPSLAGGASAVTSAPESVAFAQLGDGWIEHTGGEGSA